MAVAEEYFVAEGCGRLTMNMVLTAPGRSGIALPEFKIARKDEVLGDFVLPSLEVAGPGMHWVEVSRAVAAEGAPLSDDTKAMAEAYDEYFAAAGPAMRPGATCHDVHTAVSKGFLDRGYHLGHVTGHSIGMTMIEFPKVGEGVETELAENMVLSMHPHAIAANGEDCLYMQDTWLVTAGRRRAARRPADGDRRPLMGLADGLVRNEDGVTRCWWGGGADPHYRAYHDDEWGMPVVDDVRLFEKLSLEGFQAGLSWLTILRKREAFRQRVRRLRLPAARRVGRRATSSACSRTPSIVRHRGQDRVGDRERAARARARRGGGLAGRVRLGASSPRRPRVRAG